jgi:hypothetical protein
MSVKLTQDRQRELIESLAQRAKERVAAHAAADKALESERRNVTRARDAAVAQARETHRAGRAEIEREYQDSVAQRSEQFERDFAATQA